MREYEITIVIQPKLEESGRNELLERITGWITGGDASEENQPAANHWGIRQLAYPIRKFEEGYYVLYEAKMAPTAVSELERNLQFVEDVLRYLIVRKEG